MNTTCKNIVSAVLRKRRNGLYCNIMYKMYILYKCIKGVVNTKQSKKEVVL